jgi:hypothetical protein
MTQHTITTQSVTAISQTAARLSLAGAATFVVLLAALHLLKPELDPSWHFISEYAIGRHGWMMVLAFGSLAFSYLMLFVALRSQLRTLWGRIGLALLLVSAAGLAIAGVFTTDPITASKDAATSEGKLHNLGRLVSPCRLPPRSSAGALPATRPGPRHESPSSGRRPWRCSASWCPSRP